MNILWMIKVSIILQFLHISSVKSKSLSDLTEILIDFRYVINSLSLYSWSRKKPSQWAVFFSLPKNCIIRIVHFVCPLLHLDLLWKGKIRDLLKLCLLLICSCRGRMAGQCFSWWQIPVFWLLIMGNKMHCTHFLFTFISLLVVWCAGEVLI